MAENPFTLANTSEGMILVMATEMKAVVKNLESLTIKVERLASEQATQTALAEIGGQIRALQVQADTRLRSLEDWKTGIEARVAFASGQWKWLCGFTTLVGTIAVLLARYWK
jgi:hypothetical protein